MQTHPLEQLIDLYLSEKDITLESYELYHIILKQFVTYLKEHEILYAETNDIKKYIKSKKEEGYTIRWCHHQLGVIKVFYSYLSLNQNRLGLDDRYQYNIAEPIQNIKIKKEVSKPILTTHQAKHLILNLKYHRKYIWHFRDYAMIYLMITTGLRSIEIRRAKINDLKKINETYILYVQGKGRSTDDDFVKITKGVKEALDDYLSVREDKNPYLFISHSKRNETPHLSRTFFLRMFRRVLKEAGLGHLKVTPHSLRHAAATYNLLRGGTLEDTKRLMRHKDLSTTLIYAHHLKRMEEDIENEIESYIMSDQDIKEKKKG
jgi:site-specific recombinase XerD